MAGQRQADYRDLELAPGIFSDRTDRGASGRWKSGDNVRWRDGLPEKIKGFLAQTMLDDNAATVTYKGLARSAHQWDSLDGQNWIALGTHCKLYLISANRLYDITPLRRTIFLTNPFTMVNTFATVTVTDVGHGAATGDFVRFSGASAAGGITINGEYQITSVTSLDTYVITHTAQATSSVTGGGTVTANYDISCGLASDSTLTGYGTGDYGEEEYGDARTSSTYTGFAQVWSLQNWGEDLLASPSGGALYYWDRTLSPFSRAVIVPAAPANIEYMLVSPDDRHVIAFGANLVSTGEQDKMFVRWCSAEDFDDWIPSATNDAGSKRLDIGSKIITAVRSREQAAVLTDKALYGMAFVGGDDVFSFRPLGESLKAISRSCGVDVNGVVFFMGEDDFYVYDGTLRTLECDINSYVFGSLSRANQSKIHARVNKEFTEIWWSYPASGSSENDRTAIYNYKQNCWYISTIARECGLDRNTKYSLPVAFKSGLLYLHETGVNADTGILTAFLESYDAELDAGGNAYGLVNHLIPDFKSLTGSVDVNLFGRNYPASALVSSSVRNVTSATIRVDLRFRKRQIGIRIESNDLGDDWRMDTWRVRVTPYGRAS